MINMQSINVCVTTKQIPNMDKQKRRRRGEGSGGGGGDAEHYVTRILKNTFNCYYTISIAYGSIIYNK